ncbi:hypothetical protein BKA70DRAFT_1435493 [Coprinopsis sp. MPI-PUGE-AT-0042]|nr:hypothetical protein BKA70DRAFT_1435493 [Coprinopsis sp. MPI-PUGE-AT-0042]
MAQDDENASCASSPWFTFRETQNTIVPTVLLLEELPGGMLMDVDYERDEDDLFCIFDDLIEAKIVHRDMRPPNILEANSAKPCPKHGRPHRWFFVDWEDALIAHHECAMRYFRSYRNNLT